MRHTLITTDMTRSSINTLLYGVGFTKSLGLRAKLLHLLNKIPLSMIGGYPNSPSVEYAALDQKRLEGARRRLARIARTVNNKFRNKIIANHTVKISHAQPGILREIEAETPEILVMGTVAKDDLLNNIVGTVPTAVAVKAEVPALIVPENQAYTTVKKVLLVVADREVEAEKMQPIIDYVKIWNAKLTILNVTKENKNSVSGNRLLDQMMETCGLAYDVVKKNNNYASILEYAEGMGADLIVLPHQEQSFFEGLFTTDLSQKMILNTKIPVMIC